MPKCHHITSILRFSTKANFSAEAGCLVVSEAWVTWRVESSIQLGSHTGPAAADQPSHPKLIAAAPIASNSDIDVRQYSWTPSCLSLTGGTLRSVRALQTYGPISGRGCLLDEPASQWEAYIFIHTDLNVWRVHKSLINPSTVTSATNVFAQIKISKTTNKLLLCARHSRQIWGGVNN